MARVLCAWELGSGLGHIQRLIPIALELRAAGHEVVMALRDTAFMDTARAAGFEVIPAPLLRGRREPNPSPMSLTDVLLNLGYDDVRGLHGALQAWRSTLRLVGCGVVMADYAPMALVAARMEGIPRVTVGSGFALPPEGSPIPALRPWIAVDAQVLQSLDDRLVERMRQASGSEARSPRTARDFFAAEAHLLCTFPELDPFGAREGVEYLGPPGRAERGVVASWNDPDRTHVLAYLKPAAPRVDAVLAALSRLDAEVIVALPGIEPTRAEALSRGNLRVFAQPLDVPPLMAGAQLAVFHAGPGFAAHALVAGVPMALLPLQLEQFLVARRVEQAGIGELASPEHPAPDFEAWFAKLASSAALREAVGRAAQRHRGHSFAAAARAAAGRIAALAA